MSKTKLLCIAAGIIALPAASMPVSDSGDLSDSNICITGDKCYELGKKYEEGDGVKNSLIEYINSL